MGSPNAILRREIDGKVIVRTGRRIPGVRPVAGIYAPISVIRMAVGDAYGAEEWREGEGDGRNGIPHGTIDRKTCRAVAEYAFQHAKKMNAKVFGGPKYTGQSRLRRDVQGRDGPAASKRYPEVSLRAAADRRHLRPAPNNHGRSAGHPGAQPRRRLSSATWCCSSFGSIAGAESMLLSFDDEFNPQVVMAEAPHGTARRLFGKNIANPMAMIFSAAATPPCPAPHLFQRPQGTPPASRAISYGSKTIERFGKNNAQKPGRSGRQRHHHRRPPSTHEVIGKCKTKLEVWTTLQGKILKPSPDPSLAFRQILGRIEK